MTSLGRPKAFWGGCNEHWRVLHDYDLWGFGGGGRGLSRGWGRSWDRCWGRCRSLSGCLIQYLRLNLNEISLCVKGLCPDWNLRLCYQSRRPYARLLREHNELHCFHLC